jgi:hypothetical protein
MTELTRLLTVVLVVEELEEAQELDLETCHQRLRHKDITDLGQGLANSVHLRAVEAVVPQPRQPQEKVGLAGLRQ